MVRLVKRIVRLFAGLFLFAFGIVMNYRANLGNAPFEVLNSGAAIYLPLQVGTVAIIVGFFIVLIDWFGGEAIGFGTLANMMMIGVFMNLLDWLNLIPTMDKLVFQIPMLIGGLFVIGVGSWLYIGAGFGAGPRDSLMMLISRKTGKSLGFSRAMVEIPIVIIGALLGGNFGVGTFVAAGCGGYCLQIVCKIARFDLREVRHETLQDTYKNLKSMPHTDGDGNVEP